MYSPLGLVLLPLAVSFIWLGIITYLYLENRRFMKTLFPRARSGDLADKLKEVASFISESNLKLGDFRKELERIEKNSQGFVSKMEMVRYNPYEDTGGNMSFSLALLDKSGSGVIVTSLHSRSGTRVFAKPVILGRSGQYSFSKEEEEVVTKAMKG